MFEGLYAVRFETGLGSGAGVVFLKDGKLHGGDSSMAYHGTYAVDGDDIKAKFAIEKHTDVAGVFSTMGVDSAQLSLTGKQLGAQLVGEATSPQVPGVTLRVVLEPLVDAA